MGSKDGKCFTKQILEHVGVDDIRNKLLTWKGYAYVSLDLCCSNTHGEREDGLTPQKPKAIHVTVATCCRLCCSCCASRDYLMIEVIASRELSRCLTSSLGTL